ncbi:MAG: MerR family transcriptional regulator [Chitinophagales bacterium]
MDLFSISQLQQFSGIKAHTIRIWEQRYNALHPNRSEGNTRYYDNSQLRRLLNIVSLMDSDYKVSQLCAMTDKNLFTLINDQLKTHSIVRDEAEYFITQLLAAGMSYDEPGFDKIFSKCLERMDMKDGYTKVIYPLLERIGLMWSTDTMPPAREHFMSNIIRQKLVSAINDLPAPASSKSSWLLFLPENEFHEIGLLFAHYLIRKAGRKVYYLGSNVPFETLAQAVKEIQPGNFLFFLVHYDVPENVQDYLNSLTKTFNKTRINLSGNVKLINQLKLGRQIQWKKSVQELEDSLV